MSQEKLTIGKLCRALQDLPPDMPVTFGCSSYSRRPLVFGRTKVYGEKHLLIILEELYDVPENFHEAEPEHGLRKTVEDLLQMFENCPEDWKVSFNCTEDGSVLEFQHMGPVLAFDLVQPEIPSWRRKPE